MRASKEKLARIHELLASLGRDNPVGGMAAIRSIVRRHVDKTWHLTATEADTVIGELEKQAAGEYPFTFEEGQ